MSKYDVCKKTKVFMGPGPVSIGVCQKKRRHDPADPTHKDSKGREWHDEAPRNHRG